MELPRLIRVFSEKVSELVDADENRRKEVLPFIVGIKEGKFFSRVKIGDKRNNLVFSSLIAGHFMRRDNCDALLYAGECYVRHYTAEEYKYMCDNFSTESPELYPRHMLIPSCVLGSLNFRTGEHESYLFNSLENKKRFSVGLCIGFYPQLFSAGYKIKTNIELVEAMDKAAGMSKSLDLVVIEREPQEAL